MIESLEGRTLFTAVTINVHKGVLKIVGTERRDRIILNGPSGALAIKINGHTQMVQSRVRSVYIYAGGGNDTVDGSATTFNYYIEGGAGNDTIQTGVGDDTLFGGLGNDDLADFDLDVSLDYQDGGPGDDHLTGGSTMHGGSGHDVGNISGEVWTYTSGMEAIFDNVGIFNGVLSEDGMKLKLSTHKGHLAVTYQLDDFELDLSGPFTRADGKVGLRVNQNGNSGIGGDRSQTITLNNRYTKLALGRGLVMSFKSGHPERPVLIPMGRT